MTTHRIQLDENGNDVTNAAADATQPGIEPVTVKDDGREKIQFGAGRDAYQQQLDDMGARRDAVAARARGLVDETTGKPRPGAEALYSQLAGIVKEQERGIANQHALLTALRNSGAERPDEREQATADMRRQLEVQITARKEKQAGELAKRARGGK